MLWDPGKIYHKKPYRTILKPYWIALSKFKMNRKYKFWGITIMFGIFIAESFLSKSKRKEHLEEIPENVNIEQNILHYKRNRESSKKSNREQRRFLCENWRQGNEILRHTISKPKYLLSKQKYLFPILYNGPNNQLMGFRQAIYVAILLNRTLVMPTFRKHLISEFSSLSNIDANLRVDVERLVKIVSVVTTTEARLECGSKIGAVFQGTVLEEWTREYIQSAEEDIGVKLLKENSNIGSSKVKLAVPVFRPNTRFKMDADKRSVENVFDTDAKCAVYAFPFREINLPYTLDTETKFLPVESEIADSIFHSTGPPPFVNQLVEEFLKQKLSIPYLAIHWRFDRKDFHKFMCTVDGNKQATKGNINPFIQKFCNEVFSLSSRDVVKIILKHLSTVQRQTKDEKISTVFISAPRESIEEFLDEVEEKLNKYGINVYSQKDVKEFTKMYENKCDFINNDYSDFLSLFEMEICKNSKVFLSSALSSWSNNVLLSRKMQPKKYPFCKFDKQLIKAS